MQKRFLRFLLFKKNASSNIFYFLEGVLFSSSEIVILLNLLKSY